MLINFEIKDDQLENIKCYNCIYCEKYTGTKIGAIHEYKCENEGSSSFKGTVIIEIELGIGKYNTNIGPICSCYNNYKPAPHQLF